MRLGRVIGPLVLGEQLLESLRTFGCSAGVVLRHGQPVQGILALFGFRQCVGRRVMAFRGPVVLQLECRIAGAEAGGGRKRVFRMPFSESRELALRFLVISRIEKSERIIIRALYAV